MKKLFVCLNFIISVAIINSNALAQNEEIIDNGFKKSIDIIIDCLNIKGKESLRTNFSINQVNSNKYEIRILNNSDYPLDLTNFETDCECESIDYDRNYGIIPNEDALVTVNLNKLHEGEKRKNAEFQAWFTLDGELFLIEITVNYENGGSIKIDGVICG